MTEHTTPAILDVTHKLGLLAPDTEGVVADAGQFLKLSHLADYFDPEWPIDCRMVPGKNGGWDKLQTAFAVDGNYLIGQWVAIVTHKGSLNIRDKSGRVQWLRHSVLIAYRHGGEESAQLMLWREIDPEPFGDHLEFRPSKPFAQVSDWDPFGFNKPGRSFGWVNSYLRR